MLSSRAMLVTLLAFSNVMLVAAAVHSDCSGWSTINTDKCSDTTGTNNDCCILQSAVASNPISGFAENTAYCEEGYYPIGQSRYCGATLPSGMQEGICYECGESISDSDLAWLVVVLVFVFVVIPICLVVAVCFCGVALCSKGKPAATPQTGQPQTVFVQQPGQPQMMAMPGAQQQQVMYQQQPVMVQQQQPVMVQQPQYAVSQ